VAIKMDSATKLSKNNRKRYFTIRIIVYLISDVKLEIILIGFTLSKSINICQNFNPILRRL